MDKVEKIVVHSYPKTRSGRVVWLLKVLGIPYVIQTHHGVAGEFPPESLRKVHPVGHFPVVEVVYKTGRTKVLAELGYIFDYILRHFDVEGKLTGTTEDEKEDVLFFLFFSEGSFMTLVMPNTINDILQAGDDHPYFQTYLPRYRKDVFEFLNEWCEKRLKAGKFYLVGDAITAADIIMLGPCLMNNDLTKYESLTKWAEGMKQCPDLQEVLAEDKAQGA